MVVTARDRALARRKSPTKITAWLPQMLLAVVAPRRTLGRVDDVVVQQGGGVQVFEDGGKIRSGGCPGSRTSGRQNEQERPDALAAGKQDMAPHFGDQRHVGLEIGGQGAH